MPRYTVVGARGSGEFHERKRTRWRPNCSIRRNAVRYVGDDLYPEHTETVPESASQVRSHFNAPRQILPVQTYKGASLWRKLVAVLGLGAFTVLGGLAITLIVGIIAIVGALVVQAAIS